MHSSFAVFILLLTIVSAQQDFQVTSKEIQKCDVWQKNELTDKERVTRCSSLQGCFDESMMQFSDNMCSLSNETCSVWVVTKPSCLDEQGNFKYQDGGKYPTCFKTYNGCILKDYCELTAEYYGQTVQYKCPKDSKAEYGIKYHHTKIIDLQ